VQIILFSHQTAKCEIATPGLYSGDFFYLPSGAEYARIDGLFGIFLPNSSSAIIATFPSPTDVGFSNISSSILRNVSVEPNGTFLTLDEYESVCQKLKHQFPEAAKIIITLRGSINADHNTWSGVLYNGERFFSAPVYQITHIVDRVGAGDSFMGGLIYGLLSYGGDEQKALDFAVAASCLKHTIHGDFNLVSISEVETLMKGEASGRVVR